MLAGTRRPVTVLFSDIRGFTTIVETTADSQQLVNQLNEYFTAMVACVFRYDGSLDKFMGDGIMAIWGNTPYNFGPQEDAARAVRAALAMLTELRRLNAKWVAEGRMEWRIGIGLNHGQVIVGDMGSQQHKEFAVVGDAVNLGSRLEGLTKEYHLQILLGERVAELVRDQFHLRSVDVVQVKGKTQAVQTFTVLGEKSEALPPDQQKFLALYEEGISCFRRREFGRAKELFAQALQLQPGDYLAAQYLASCVAFIENPPDALWTGVRVMTQK
jgi:adenylate cyclase